MRIREIPSPSERELKARHWFNGALRDERKTACKHEEFTRPLDLGRLKGALAIFFSTVFVIENYAFYWIRFRSKIIDLFD